VGGAQTWDFCGNPISIGFDKNAENSSSKYIELKNTQSDCDKIWCRNEYTISLLWIYLENWVFMMKPIPHLCTAFLSYL